MTPLCVGPLQQSPISVRIQAPSAEAFVEIKQLVVLQHFINVFFVRFASTFKAEQNFSLTIQLPIENAPPFMKFGSWHLLRNFHREVLDFRAQLESGRLDIQDTSNP